MKKSQISFKFKNEKNYDSIKFVGGSITLKDLKSKIKEKLQQTKASSGPSKDKEKDKDDILVYDEQTKELIKEDSAVIASDKKVIIERAVSIPTPMFRGPGDFGNQYSMNTGYRPPDPNQRMMPSSYQTQQNPYYTSKPPTYPIATTTTTTNVDNKQLSFQDIQKYFVDAKYFMIKSSNFYNIDRSISFGEWATTKNNEAKLNNAYNTSKNVILLFSVNKSSQFQGYARMESPSTNKVVSWQDQDSIKLGGCFKVNWLRVCTVNFSRISHLKNKYNNNEPIKKSRDTQELPADIGYEICKMFEVPDRDTVYPPVSEYDRRPMMPYGSNIPGDNKEGESLSSDTASPSGDKTPGTSKLQNEDGSSEALKEEEFKEEMKEAKPEKKVDLLADLGFDDDMGFGYEEPEEPVESDKNKREDEQVQEVQETQEEQRIQEENKTPETQQQTQEKESVRHSEGTEEEEGKVEEIRPEEFQPKESEKPLIQTPLPNADQPPLPMGRPEMPPMMRPQMPMDNRPPPPGFPQMGRGYPGSYGAYPPSYPQMPYQYPGSYPRMPPMGMPNMGMNPYYGYQQYNYPQMNQMWPGQQQQFPPGMQGNVQPSKKEDESDAESEDSEKSRKKAKKKKEKKKKKKRSSSRSRSRSRSKSRSKSYKPK